MGVDMYARLKVRQFSLAFEGRRLGGETFATFNRRAAALLRTSGQDCLLLTAD